MGRRWVAGLVAVGLGVSGIAASATPAGAATFEVTSAGDDGSAGTLRWAIDQANASPEDDVIDVEPALTDIELVDCSTGRLEVAGVLTVNGNDVAVRQTCPGHGVFGGSGTLTLDHVTVNGGTAGGDGGGISITGDVTLTHSTVSYNAAIGSGGGVVASHLTVLDSAITDNTTSGGGGGIFVRGDAHIERSVVRANHGGGAAVLGDATITDSTFEGNDAGMGGALYAFGAVSVHASTISHNHAVSGYAGIFGDEVELVDSTVVGNHTDGLGGGVGGSDVTVLRSTITQNSANDTGGVSAVRAEITDSAVVVNAAQHRNSAITILESGSITNSTVAGNVGPGPAIDTSAFGASSVELDHATVAANTGGVGLFLSGPFRSYASLVAGNGTADCVLGPGSGEIHSDGYSASGDDSCGFNNATDLTSIGDPGLGVVGLHGGPTPNLVPQSGSPLLNRIPASDARCTGSDQRGFARPANGACDIGAVEVRAVSSVGTAVTTAFETPIQVDLVPLVTDPDGVLATYEVAPPTSGSVDAADGGLVTYGPDAGFSGTDSFTYVVCSIGQVICTTPAAVSIAVGAAPAQPIVVTPHFTG